MKRLSIKARIALMCTLLAAMVAALALSVLLCNEQRVMDAYFADSLAATAHLAHDDIRSEDGRLEIDRNLDDLPNVRVAIYNLDGDLIYGQQRFELPFSGTGEIREAQDASGARWMVQDSRMDFEDVQSVWLRCYMNAGALEGMRGVRRDVLLAMFPVLVLLAALGGWLVARRSLRPIARIIRTAEGIADGKDLNKRIKLQGARDEIYQTAQVFDAMLDRLDASFERERRFTSDVAHELRTPVAGILAQSEYALSAEASDSDRKAALREISRAGRRMSVLMQRLLALARLDAQRGPGAREKIDLAELAEIAAESMQERASERGMRIQTDCVEDAFVPGDQTMLMQAVLNLVENAVKHGLEGGRIRIDVHCAGENCSLSVQDDGPGIATEDMEHIFERFYQADASRSSGGFGLGLSLVSRIVQLHGGRMEVESAPGTGSRFTMLLPLDKGEEDVHAPDA